MGTCEIKNINVANYVFAEYDLIYRKADGFGNVNFEYERHKNRLQFIKFKKLSQQYNLMFIDNSFPLLIGDIGLEALIKYGISISEYFESNTKQNILTETTNKDIKTKFTRYIHFLLYGISQKKHRANPSYNFYNAYYVNDNNNDLVGYAYTDYPELYPLIYNKLRFEIAHEKSIFGKRYIILHLKVWTPIESELTIKFKNRFKI
jgi:hypothetical protein